MQLLYTLLIRLYVLMIFLASPLNHRAFLWINGRRNQKMKPLDVDGSRRRIWIHCASLGEFEQGRPIIETIRQEIPDAVIILTFFSPSGYEIRKNYSQADIVLYLPADLPHNSRQFLDLYKPDLAIFIKYEFWFNYLKILYSRHIPVIFVSAIFRPSQHFFKWYGSWFRKFLKKADRIFVQDKASLLLLESIGLNHAVLAGDTRFDRVLENSRHAKEFPVIEKFKGNSQIVIGGSTWPPDEDLMINLMKNAGDQVKFIIAPHEVDRSRIQSLISKISGQIVLFSEIDKQECQECRVLIIDSIGILSHLYQYADVALIGGGFGKGIHNILEAATFGVPVLFGPNYQKFKEARDLIGLKGAFPLNDHKEFVSIANGLLSDPQLKQQTGKICAAYVLQNTGATNIVIQYVKGIISNP